MEHKETIRVWNWVYESTDSDSLADIIYPFIESEDDLNKVLSIEIPEEVIELINDIKLTRLEVLAS